MTDGVDSEYSEFISLIHRLVGDDWRGMCKGKRAHSHEERRENTYIRTWHCIQIDPFVSPRVFPRVTRGSISILGSSLFRFFFSLRVNHIPLKITREGKRGERLPRAQFSSRKINERHVSRKKVSCLDVNLDLNLNLNLDLSNRCRSRA